jgi:hypothetical protein
MADLQVQEVVMVVSVVAEVVGHQEDGMAQVEMVTIQVETLVDSWADQPAQIPVAVEAQVQAMAAVEY